MPSNECAPNPVTGSGEQRNTDTSTHLTYDGVKEPDWAPVAAHRYARHGLEIGPLNGKVPLTRHGMKDFTTDLEQIKKWWEQHPGANIGARPPSGVVVVDIDPRNGGGETWAALTAHREIPETILVATGGGGHHFWFRLPHAGDVRGALGAGVDLKTNSGYLVMPPSIHPTTGERYLIAWWADIAPLPGYLVEHVYKPPRAAVSFPARRGGPGGGQGLVDAVAGSREGQRNHMLYWAACRNVDEGLGLELELIAAGVQAGLSEQEATRTVHSAVRKVA